VGKDGVALQVLAKVVLGGKGVLLLLLARVIVLVNLEKVILLPQVIEGHSVR